MTRTKNSRRRPRIRVRKVWSHNLRRELDVLDSYLSDFPVVAIDTEFPGFLRCTPRGAPEREFYEDLKFNVNQMNILQLGVTVADESGRVAMTWEFNFSFDEAKDVHSVASVEFLKDKGLDFEKLKRKGIAPEEFRVEFLPICFSGRIEKWVTFHGLYDVAYLLKLLKVRRLPESMALFAATARYLLGTVSDLKHMARHCDGLLKGELGLEKLANLLDVKRIGTAHQAGSDSLLTASVYGKMKQNNLELSSSSEHCEGFLYGLHFRIWRPLIKIVQYPFDQYSSSQHLVPLFNCPPPPPPQCYTTPPISFLHHQLHCFYGTGVTTLG